jgi:hypothetical protein
MISAGTDGGALITSVNDADFDPANEIELPAGGTNGQVLSTDGAGNYAWADDADTGGTIVSADGGNMISTGTDGGALITSVNDADFDPANEIELPDDSGATNGDVLSTDAAGNFSWITPSSNNLFDNDLTLSSDRTHNLGGNDFILGGSGNVAIGAITPQDKLDVDGQIRARNGFAATDGTANLPSYGFYTNNDNDTGMFRAAVNQLAFSTGGTEALRINASQNVGIGIVPTEKLHVNGNILATGTITPDYVFQYYYNGESLLKPQYSMSSLSEIEEFTKLNKHLPGVPSAYEIEQQGGIVVNRSTEINLEKIEELFLHTIEQEKKINQLKIENDTLSSEIKLLRKDLDKIKELLKNK